MHAFKPLVSIPTPSQPRSQQALERFLSAGEALLADNRFEDAGIAEIARQAESSVGSFYRILGDKENLSLLLLQRFILHVEQMVVETFDPALWKDKTVNEVARTFVDVFVRSYQGRRGVLRALILRASRDAEFRDRVHVMNEHIADNMRVVLALHRKEIKHPKPGKATTTVVHAVLGALNQHTVTGSLGELSEKELKIELTRMFTRYLGVE
tara:strand:+ start:46508 stop:47140 length:633 start_codon:yes stop_codon:yes gene_type:complete